MQSQPAADASAAACAARLAREGGVGGPLVPLVGGAVAGAACWVPTYPLDVIKTHVQAGKGDGFAACARRPRRLLARPRAEAPAYIGGARHHLRRRRGAVP